jgi:antitoxin HigA-1
MDTTTPIGAAANKPGEILRTEFLEPLGLSQNELATKTGLDRMRISEIVRGRRAITAETAMALGKVFETGPKFWMNLQTNYDLAICAHKSRPRLMGAIVRDVLRADREISYAVVGVKKAIAHKVKGPAAGKRARKSPVGKRKLLK